MFQSFQSATSPEQGPPRLAALRAEMARAGLDGFLVPRADAHQGEYVAACDERLAWLTGFSGSAGFCCVLAGRAGLFVDGRYRTQAPAEVDTGVFEVVGWPETTLADWLKAALADGGRIGFDPWLHSPSQIAELRRALEGTGITLEAGDNLVDRIWQDRPARPRRPIEVYPERLAGEGQEAKRLRLGAELDKAGQQAAVLTLPDGICWLLNIRGTDLPHTPVVQAFAVLDRSGRVDLFTEATADEAVRGHLGAAVVLHPYDGLLDHLSGCRGTVRVDPKTVPLAVKAHLEALAAEKAGGLAVAEGEDPTILPKACKNAAEMAGARAAHLRDAAAMCEFLAWLDDAAPKGGLSEIEVVRALEGFRRATNALRDISFDTICGAGPNGAIVHYRVTEATNRPITPGDIVLVDSGGQYLDGTTDITRTVATGPVSAEQRAIFTRVLQGMIAISRARWPKGLAGRDLDPLARVALWMAGQDYDHGTGHGVGAFLSVHEGPQRISRLGEVALRPGMILSNEPGYYREGAFGIRIENLVAVRVAPPLAGADAREMLDFETLSHVPIDRRLIEPGMLSAGERDWLNAYHAAVAERVGPRLEARAAAWLRLATAPL